MNGWMALSSIATPSLTEYFFDFSRSSKNRTLLFAIAIIGLLGFAYAIIRCIHFKAEKWENDQKTCESPLNFFEQRSKSDSEEEAADPQTPSLKTLQEKGYAIIPFLQPETIQSLFDDLKNFDMQPESYKEQFALKDQVEIGYAALKNKKVFVIRNRQIPDDLKNFIPYLSSVHALALDILHYIEKEQNLHPGELTEAASKEPLPAAGNSTSLLRLFTYDPCSDGVSADVHEDLGLLTIIPCSQVPGLEIMDYQKDCQWIHVEKQADPSHAIVLVGRTLEKLTEGKYPAATHRVQKNAQKRFSIVYQLRAEPYTKISTPEGQITVEEWLTHLKKGLRSINGTY